MNLIIEDNIKETVAAGHVVRTRSQGSIHTRPDDVVILEAPASKRVCTGFGAASFRLWMTQAAKDELEGVTGHGKIITAPYSTLLAMIPGSRMRYPFNPNEPENERWNRVMS